MIPIKLKLSNIYNLEEATLSIIHKFYLYPWTNNNISWMSDNICIKRHTDKPIKIVLKRITLLLWSFKVKYDVQINVLLFYIKKPI